MAMGCKKGSLYVLDNKALAAFVAIRFGKATDEIWHQRLGHRSEKSLKFLNSQGVIYISVWHKVPSICTSCQMGKSCKLPFFLNNKIATVLLMKVHCDLWGPAPMSSSLWIKYYVIFVDDCTRFTWFYPL